MVNTGLIDVNDKAQKAESILAALCEQAALWRSCSKGMEYGACLFHFSRRHQGKGWEFLHFK